MPADAVMFAIPWWVIVAGVVAALAIVVVAVYLFSSPRRPPFA